MNFKWGIIIVIYKEIKRSDVVTSSEFFLSIVPPKIDSSSQSYGPARGSYSSNKRRKEARKKERRWLHAVRTCTRVRRSDTTKAAESVCASFDLFAAFRSCRRLAWLISRLFTPTRFLDRLVAGWLGGRIIVGRELLRCAVARACATTHAGAKTRSVSHATNTQMYIQQRTHTYAHALGPLFVQVSRWNGSQRVGQFRFVAPSKWFPMHLHVHYEVK